MIYNETCLLIFRFWINEDCIILTVNILIFADVIDEAKEEVESLGLDPYDDFKEMTVNVESELIKCLLDHEDFLEAVSFIVFLLVIVVWGL